MQASEGRAVSDKAGRVEAAAVAKLRYINRTHGIADRWADVGIRHCDDGKAATALNMASQVPWSAMRHAHDDCAAFDRALGRKA